MRTALLLQHELKFSVAEKIEQWRVATDQAEDVPGSLQDISISVIQTKIILFSQKLASFIFI
jgi:hypothetical protein